MKELNQETLLKAMGDVFTHDSIHSHPAETFADLLGALGVPREEQMPLLRAAYKEAWIRVGCKDPDTLDEDIERTYEMIQEHRD